MLKRSSVILPLLVLVACGTPQEQCISANTQELRTLERLIAETEGNVQRGYAIEDYTVSVPHWVPCGPPPTPPAPGTAATPQALCIDTYDRIETRPKAIDLAIERAKLASMQKKRVELARAAQSVIAQCKVLHPQ